MTSAEWSKLTALFETAIELPAAGRAGFLDRECAGDPGLRARLEAMLDAGDRPSPQVERLIADLVPWAGPSLAGGPVAGLLVGPYRLIEEVGRGGMGTVWRAERADGAFGQTVAIKFIRRGMDTGETVRRFHRERQILCVLDHPHIARLLDGGATAEGRPYLVMEFIEGRPLLEDCDRRGLGERARLALFLTVCAAVEHAHSRLVIHRDLKPGNILVRADGGVKLLDFGIARLIEDDDADRTVTSLAPLTPAYASPEQRAGLALSTATDIYSLGVILDALLPERRSGDLAAIVAKATRTEPELRYPSAGAFAHDLRRYLEGQPVEARSGALTYRAARYLSRHALAVVAALGLLGLALASLGYIAVQRQWIAQERDRAENVSRFLRDLFAAADPDRNQGQQISTREMLDLGVARVRAAADLGSRQQLLETMAEAYLNLGLYEKAARLYREIEESESGENTLPDKGRMARAAAAVGEAEAYLGRHAEAEAAATRAIASLQSLSAADAALVLLRRCNQLHLATRYEPAAAACREAAVVAEGASLRPVDRAAISIAMGNALMDGSRFDGAAAAFAEALAIGRQAPGGPVESVVAQAQSSLAALYFRQGRLAESEAAFTDAIAFKRRLYPEGHLDLARTLNNLANTVVSRQRFAEAVPLFTEAHALYRRFLGPESSELASSLSNLAIAYSRLGRLDEAATLCRDVVAMQARTIGAGKLPHLSARIKYGSILLEQGKTREGVAELEETLAGLERLTTRPRLQCGYTRALLALGLVESGRAGRAEALARRGAEELTPLLRPGHWMLQLTQVARGAALVRLGRPTEGRQMLLPAVAEARDRGWWVELGRRYAAPLK